ncbi:RNA polymerase sigma factor (sigma-70 family) [Paenarthrobacter nicotinovorans]|uniref:sigma-70 family RNA polymerase sigma factor n=1 Tax=Micrococcaceae TaxID=1268 RepID=UPI00087657C7|nr:MULTISPECIES: sigma-70 family RNA polymerase sigma factor [Micrococcaceae]MDR6437572.1 RNA polymerase sigma factor (sigma-70 family) [Paenarthrobacter nicotinovorans]SCZ60755.1 RNA polymerase sigma factor, sigma-70 family [Arthrobacter sp. UNCCL28]
MDQVVAVSADAASPFSATASGSDPQLIALVREGDTNAFDVLYQRHMKVAQFVARSQTDNPSDADDVVAESFATIFQLLTEGKGPKEFFRSYLLTVVRRTAHDRNRKARRLPMAEEDAILDAPVIDNDQVVSDLESSMMAKAFKSLPERWQAVLWHLDIEGLKPAAAAPFVGLTPNGVSALALRAREGLRQAYLQQHISRTVDEACDEYASQLGKYARNALKRTSKEKVSVHLESCAKCTALLIELNDIQGGMRSILFPLLTGITFTPAGAAAIGLGGTAMGAATGSTASTGIPGNAGNAGNTAIPGNSGTHGIRGLSNAWKLAAALVVGVMALAGSLMWFLQPSPSSQSTAASEGIFNLPPAQETSMPTATPSPAESLPASPEVPAVVAPLETPSTDSPAATVPQPPAVVVPPAVAPRKAVVVDSGTVTSTPVPPGAPGAPATQTVNATFAASQGANPTERELGVQFSLQGQGTPTTGQVDFALPDQATFLAGKTVAAAGWTCAAVSSGDRNIRCSTASLAGDDLTFVLGVAMPASATTGTLDYRFSGQGVVAKNFTNTFS